MNVGEDIDRQSNMPLMYMKSQGKEHAKRHFPLSSQESVLSLKTELIPLYSVFYYYSQLELGS